jgi:hypothetical protein
MGNDEELGRKEGDANEECASEEEVKGWRRRFRLGGACASFHPCEEFGVLRGGGKEDDADNLEVLVSNVVDIDEVGAREGDAGEGI